MSPPARAPLPSPHTIIAELDRLSGDARASLVCDVCGEKFVGNPGGRGLLLWKRGDEVRYEEPVLCRRCAPAITAAGNEPFEDEDDGEG